MRRPLDIPESLQELIRHLPPEVKRKLRQGLDEIEKNPEIGKALREDLEGMRNYPLGKLRILYREKETAIQVVAIGPRRTIYQAIALEIKRVRENQR